MVSSAVLIFEKHRVYTVSLGSQCLHIRITWTDRKRQPCSNVYVITAVVDSSPTDRSARVSRLPTPWGPNKRPAKCWEWCSSRSCCAGHRSFCWTSCSPCARKPTVQCPTTWPRYACGWGTCPRRSIQSSTRYSTRRSEPRLSGRRDLVWLSQFITF